MCDEKRKKRTEEKCQLDQKFKRNFSPKDMKLKAKEDGKVWKVETKGCRSRESGGGKNWVTRKMITERKKKKKKKKRKKLLN